MRNTRNYLEVHSVVDGPIVPPTPPTSPDPVTYEVILPNGAGYTAAFVAGSSSPAAAGSTVNFTVTADEGYEVYIVTVNGGNTLTAVNGVYTINAIAANTTIKAEAELIPAPVTYNVLLPSGEGYSAALIGSSSPAVAGSTVYFAVVAYEGYEITSVTDGTNTLPEEYGVYIINAIAADTTIEVEATPIPAPVTYDVTLPTDTGYTADFVAGSSSPAVAGSVVNFTVVPDAGYEITEVSAGGNTLTPVNGVYTINGIAADIAVVVEVARIPAPVTYTVTLPEGEGYSAALIAGSSSPAVAGSTVYFAVVAYEGYEITSVTDGTNTLPEEYGVYIINAIAADIEIEVEAVPVTPPTPVTYDVVLPAKTGYTAAFVAGSSSPAVAGSTVNFTVVPDAGYEIIEVNDGINLLTPVNGVYTINAIAADIVIEVITSTPVTYTVSLPTAKAYTAAFVDGSSSPAVAGSDVNFTVVPEEGYEIIEVYDGPNIATAATLTAVNGVYTINAIAADTMIFVEAVPIGG